MRSGKYNAFPIIFRYILYKGIPGVCLYGLLEKKLREFAQDEGNFMYITR